MLGKSLLNKVIVAPKYHCVPPNVWQSIPSARQLGSQDLCCMCIEFTLYWFFSLFLWDKSWPSILCRDNAESFLWASESSCLQHAEILRSRVCLACYLESLTAPTFSSLNFSRIMSSRGTVKAKSDSRDQTSLGDSSIFSLSRPWQCLWPWQPCGDHECVVAWFDLQKWLMGKGQSGPCRREVALGDRSGDSLVITICCSYISQLFPLSLLHFHKNILNLAVVGNIALSEFSSGQNMILKGSSSN